MSEEAVNETTGEILPVAYSNRTVDLRDRATDSWTDVLGDAITLARGIANTDFVPKAMRGSEAKVTAAILYSRELGLPPMTGLSSTDVIEGKATLSAEMQRALILQAGHELQIAESTRERCVIRGRRKGTEEWTTATWTMQEANQTQVFISKDKGWGPLASKTQWRSWPAEMLLARATTRLARMIFPDVIHGMRSTEEMLDMQQDPEVASGPATEAAPPAQQVQRRRVAPKPLTNRAPSAQPVPDPQQPASESSEAEAEPVGVVDEVPAAPVQRARAPKPPARGQQQAPAAVDEPSQPEIVESELVEPAAAAEEKQIEDMNDRHVRAVAIAQQHWTRLEVADRAERLWYAGVILGHEVTSHKALSDEELRTLIGVLEKARSIDAINALVDKGVQR